MYRSEDEKLADIVMGDAVLQLLKQAGPVTTLALLEKLRAMAASETDPHASARFAMRLLKCRTAKVRLRAKQWR